MLNDTCLIYLLLQLLVEEQREGLKMGDGGVAAAAAAAVAPVVKQITAKIV